MPEPSRSPRSESVPTTGVSESVGDPPHAPGSGPERRLHIAGKRVDVFQLFTSVQEGSGRRGQPEIGQQARERRLIEQVRDRFKARHGDAHVRWDTLSNPREDQNLLVHRNQCIERPPGEEPKYERQISVGVTAELRRPMHATDEAREAVEAQWVGVTHLDLVSCEAEREQGLPRGQARSFREEDADLARFQSRHGHPRRPQS